MTDETTPEQVPARRERLAAERTDYRAGSLPDEVVADADPDPFALLDRWLDDAFARREDVGDLAEPTAVVLSTVDTASGVPRPRSRTVLLKAIDAHGLVFYTNKESAKGRELAADPWASMLLPWYPLQRQVRVDGRVEHVADVEADAYWASRPRGSQLGGWASDQSRPISSRAALDAQHAAVEARFPEGVEVPRPPHWGGYRLVPDRIELWQGRPGRFHDRIVHTRDAEDAPWRAERLQP